MKHISTIGLALVAFGMMAFVSGCMVEKEKDHNRAKLIVDKYVPDDMDKWIAVPSNYPKPTTEGGKGVTYYRLATHNAIPDSMEGFFALSPALFEKVSGIKLPAAPAGAPSLIVLKARKKILKANDGWVALPEAYPSIQKENDSFAMATLSSEAIIPKDMDGWVALDKETMAKLAEADEMSKNTIPKKK